MNCTGTVEGGGVKLSKKTGWADGTKARVEPLELRRDSRPQFTSADLIGSVDGDGLAATYERVRKVMRCDSAAA